MCAVRASAACVRVGGMHACIAHRAVSSRIQRGQSPMFANAQRVFDRVCGSIRPRSTVRLLSTFSRSHMALPTPTFGGMRVEGSAAQRCPGFESNASAHPT